MNKNVQVLIKTEIFCVFYFDFPRPARVAYGFAGVSAHANKCGEAARKLIALLFIQNNS